MEPLTLDLQLKLKTLELQLSQYQGVIVAFSGGTDSSLLLFIARKVLGKANAIGVISNSESLKTKDFVLARAFCSQYDIRLEVIRTNELADNRYNTNPPDRCFFCKTHLYTALDEVEKKHPGFTVLNGTNVEDLGDYRPGLKAAGDYNVASPLANVKFTKNDIRALAKHFELINWDKPASPCLSSRIPYNQSVTPEKLRQIETAEEAIGALGFNDVRVRHYGNECRIEVQSNEIDRLQKMGDRISKLMQSIGFGIVTIDAEGLVSGKLNRAINIQ